MSDNTDKSTRVVSVLSRPGTEVTVTVGTFGKILVILVFSIGWVQKWSWNEESCLKKMTNTSQCNVTSQVPVAKGTRETVSHFPESFSDVISHRVINVEHVHEVTCTSVLTSM